MAADVVVINHHLFFADLAVRESGMAELLPSGAGRWCSTRRTSSTKPACSSSACSSAPGRRSISRATCWRPGCSMRAAWSTGSSWWRRRARRARPAAGGRQAMARRQAALGRRVAGRRARGSLAGGAGRLQQAFADAARGLATVSELVTRFRPASHDRAQQLARARRALRRGLRRRIGALGGCGHAAAAGRSRRWTSPRRCASRVLKTVVRAGGRRRRRRARARLGVHLGHPGRRPEAALVHRALRPRRRRSAARVQSPFDYARQAALLRPAGLPQAERPGRTAQQVAHCWRHGGAGAAGRTHPGPDHHPARAAHHRRRDEAAVRAPRRRDGGPRCWCRASCPSGC